jgi:methyl-accepting chemotaxis protein
MQAASDDSRRVAEWVGALGHPHRGDRGRLQAVESSTARIGDIAAEVGILAINARIVAARAGEHGKGFAVVAEAISDLARQTAEVTSGISGDVGRPSAPPSPPSATRRRRSWRTPTVVLESGHSTDAALNAIGGASGNHASGCRTPGEDLGQSDAGQRRVPPRARSARRRDRESTGAQVHDGHARVEALIDLAETLVQANAAIGGATDDASMIEIVQSRANRIAEAFADALTTGTHHEADLFRHPLRPHHRQRPANRSDAVHALTDRLLPPIQEPVLDLDPRIVFCAAVDRNGYLPTHNRKFSHPQSADPVWNAAHCRNRRIFDDRVGLKAGRSTAPFLLQVYRRDMGGGRAC